MWTPNETALAQWYRFALKVSYAKIGRRLGKDATTVRRHLDPRVRASQAAYQKGYYQRNREAVLTRQTAYYQRTREDRVEWQRRYRAEVLGQTPRGTPRTCACCGSVWRIQTPDPRYCPPCRSNHAKEETAVRNAVGNGLLADRLHERQRGVCAWSGEPLAGKTAVHHVRPWRTFPPNTMDQHTVPANTVLVLAKHHREVEGLPHEAFKHARFEA